jgi:hypothetical protein
MVAVIEVIVLVLLFAAAVSRLLGVRLRLTRALLAGLLGVAAGILFAFLIYRRHPGQVTPWWWVPG